jgi:hypothetical protein
MGREAKEVRTRPTKLHNAIDHLQLALEACERGRSLDLKGALPHLRTAVETGLKAALDERNKGYHPTNAKISELLEMYAKERSVDRLDFHSRVETLFGLANPAVHGSGAPDQRDLYNFQTAWLVLRDVLDRVFHEDLGGILRSNLAPKVWNSVPFLSRRSSAGPASSAVHSGPEFADLRLELTAAVAEYDRLPVDYPTTTTGHKQDCRLIHLVGWPNGVHYEFLHRKRESKTRRKGIGAEFHLESVEAARIAARVKREFEGQPVGLLQTHLEWDGEWEEGCLRAVFPLSAEPGVVSAAMRDLIKLTHGKVGMWLAELDT